jgi:hypothetical protein
VVPETKARGLMHQYNVRVPFKRTVMGIARLFLESDMGNTRYLLVAMDYFAKWPEVFLPSETKRHQRQQAPW